MFPRKLSLTKSSMIILVTLVLVTPFAIVRPVVGERAVGLTWNRTYSTDWYSVARSVAQTKDGGFIMTGQGLGHGLWVMKANAVGGPVWQRTYTLAPPFYDEYGDWVTLTIDGGYAVSGKAVWATPGSGPTYSYGWLLKLDAGGNVEWSKTYGEPCAPYGGPESMFRSAVQTSDGGYAVAGLDCFGPPFHFNGHDISLDNGWVLRLDPDGNIVWQEKFVNETVYSVDVTRDKGIIVAGSVLLSGTASAEPTIDPWLLKLDPNGNSEWQRTYDFTSNYTPPCCGLGALVQVAHSAHQTPDGGYIAVGEREIEGPDGGAKSSSTLIFKIDPDGNILWQRSYGGYLGYTTPYSAQQTSDDGFIIAGGSSALVGPTGPWILKLDAEGNLVWQKIYGGGQSDFYQAQETADGGIIAVGKLDTSTITCCTISAWATKLDSNGNVHRCPVGVLSNASLTDTFAVVANTTVTAVYIDSTVTSTLVTVTRSSFPIQNQCNMMNTA